MLNPDIINITSYGDFKAHFGGFPRSGWQPYYFRGIRADFDLVPSLCYADLFNKIKDMSEYEDAIMTEFEKIIVNNCHISNFKKNNWELWFMARHFGLKSRLIDFTKDDTAALQFAFEDAKDKPVRIYCLNSQGVDNIYTQDLLERERHDPFTFNERCMIQPAPLYMDVPAKSLGVSRIIIQSGKFFYQPLNSITVPLTEQIPSKFWKVFEINNKYFDAIKDEIRGTEGIDITKPLLKNKVWLDEQCAMINIGCLS